MRTESSKDQETMLIHEREKCFLNSHQSVAYHEPTPSRFLCQSQVYPTTPRLVVAHGLCDLAAITIHILGALEVDSLVWFRVTFTPRTCRKAR